MHVIIDATTTQDQFAYAGVGQYTKNIILSLVKKYPNTLYSILLFDEKDSTLEPEIQRYKNVQIERIGKYHLNDYKNEIWYYTRVLPKINEIKRKGSIYFCPYFWRDYPSYTMPTVLFVHDMNLPMFNMYSQQSRVHNFIRRIQYWYALNKSKKCEYIITNTNTTKEDYLRYYPNYPKDKVFVSYLASDMEEKDGDTANLLPLDVKSKGYLIYHGGGINWSKNTLGVIKGYKEFLRLLKPGTIPPYLVISGKVFTDQSKQEVREMNDVIEELGIRENVVFTGFYRDEQKYSLLKNSFAFIHLALYEGFGIAPLEAIKSKVPVILHESKVYKEVFDSMVNFVNGSNHKEVGKKIYEVYMNREKYFAKAKEAYKLSFKYTWDETAKITHDVLSMLNKEINN
jgi:glycosyltransferase involved in cell wall biosynthesis